MVVLSHLVPDLIHCSSLTWSPTSQFPVWAVVTGNHMWCWFLTHIFKARSVHSASTAVAANSHFSLDLIMALWDASWEVSPIPSCSQPDPLFISLDVIVKMADWSAPSTFQKFYCKPVITAGLFSSLHNCVQGFLWTSLLACFSSDFLPLTRVFVPIMLSFLHVFLDIKVAVSTLLPWCWNLPVLLSYILTEVCEM